MPTCGRFHISMVLGPSLPQFGRATYQNATEVIVWPTLRGFGGVANRDEVIV